jgi:hypothetical protein
MIELSFLSSSFIQFKETTYGYGHVLGRTDGG